MTPVYRPAERESFCRVCDKVIEKGSPAVFWWSHRNRGQSIIICPACVETLYELILKGGD